MYGKMCGEGNPAGVRLRGTVPEDDSFLLGVYASTREDELALTGWNQQQKNIFLRMQFDAQRASYASDYPNAEYWIIQHDGVDVGRMITNRNGKQIALIDLAVLPQFRNRKIASSLMADLLEEAARTTNSVRLHVERFNPALQWYERLGFRMVTEGPIYLDMVWEPAKPETPVGSAYIATSGHGTDRRAV